MRYGVSQGDLVAPCLVPTGMNDSTAGGSKNKAAPERGGDAVRAVLVQARPCRN